MIDLQSEVQGGHETYPKTIELIGGYLDTNSYPWVPVQWWILYMMSNDLETEEDIAQEALAGWGKYNTVLAGR